MTTIILAVVDLLFLVADIVFFVRVLAVIRRELEDAKKRQKAMAKQLARIDMAKQLARIETLLLETVERDTVAMNRFDRTASFVESLEVKTLKLAPGAEDPGEKTRRVEEERLRREMASEFGVDTSFVG